MLLEIEYVLPLIDINQQNLFDFSVSVDWVERGETQLIKLQKINMGYRHLQTPGASYFFCIDNLPKKKNRC